MYEKRDIQYGTMKKCFTFHGAIDDATGAILVFFFTQGECIKGYLEIMKHMINKRFGVQPENSR